MNSIERMKTRGMVPRAALYARFSSSNQREESIDAQLRALHKYCTDNSVVVCEEYCDHAKSATTDDRPEFLRMVQEAKDGRFDFVVVHKLDRFSRNRYDSAHYKRELKKHGVELISVLENMDGSPESIILESMLEGMSEYYSKNLAREVMKGMRESAMKCRSVGGRPPFGYKVNPETKLFEINEEEAQGVRLIFDRINCGRGYSAVITELNELGFRTRNGNPFGKNSLYEILRNERYKGIYIFNRAVSHNISRKRNNHASKSEDEIIRIPGGMPRLVEDDVFDRVQALLGSRKLKETSRRAKENYLLTGVISCGICGKSMNGTASNSGRNKRRLVAYTCGGKHTHGNMRCKNKDVNRDYLEDFIVKRVGEVIFDEKNLPRLLKTYKNCSGELNSDTQRAVKKIAASIKATEQKIANIINVITQSGSPTLLSTLNQLEEEKRQLLRKLEEEQAKLAELHLDEAQIKAAFHRAQKMFKDGTLDSVKQLLKLYVKQVNVFPDYVVIELYNIDGTILKPSQIKQSSVFSDVDTIQADDEDTKQLSHTERCGTGKKLVEATGIETYANRITKPFTSIAVYFDLQSGLVCLLFVLIL